jgi:glycosyltransferase involved in cell wall biosynthesis
VPRVSVTIITLNEAEHIAAAIDSVSWADEIVVVDSGSTDATLDIARARGARVSARAWTGYADQKNHAASLASHDWIFSLDADERVTPELAGEVQALVAAEPPRRGYRMPRVTFHLGRWIRTTDFYPDYQARLYDRRAARWQGELVHESVQVDGSVGYLRGEIQHYSFRDLSDHVARVHHYSTLAARQLHARGRRATAIHVLMHPPAAFLRNYVLRRGFLDGSAGLLVSLVNAYSVFLKFAKLWELRTNPKSQIPNPTSNSPSPTPNSKSQLPTPKI